VNTEGSLAFYHFGWELLQCMRALGYVDVRACQYWSRDLGYLGRDQLIFFARRAPGGRRRALVRRVLREWVRGLRRR
jgi:hypothetical protein